MFFAPIYSIVPIEAAAPALVVAGALMIGQSAAFLTIVGMPFTYSIANGIGVGFTSLGNHAVGSGRGRQVHPLLWIVALLCAAYFAIQPITDAFT